MTFVVFNINHGNYIYFLQVGFEDVNSSETSNDYSNNEEISNGGHRSLKLGSGVNPGSVGLGLLLHIFPKSQLFSFLKKKLVLTIAGFFYNFRLFPLAIKNSKYI